MIARESQAAAPAFPALRSLGLDSTQLAALALRGTLRAEGSSQRKRYFKLRFRIDSTQCVRYVGCHPEFVARVEQELLRLQSASKSARELKKLTDEARSCLRSTTRDLAPNLRDVGRRFHGREIRCTDRNRKACQGLTQNEPSGKIIMDENQTNGDETTLLRHAANQLPLASRTKNPSTGGLGIRTQMKKPLRPSIRNATVVLLEISSKVGDRINSDLDAQPPGLRAVKQAIPALNVLAQVHRQAIRYVVLDRELKAEQKADRITRRRRLESGNTPEKSEVDT